MVVPKSEAGCDFIWLTMGFHSPCQAVTLVQSSTGDSINHILCHNAEKLSNDG